MLKYCLRIKCFGSVTIISNPVICLPSVPLAGKDRAVACGALPLLRDMLNDPTMEVRANAAGAIMT